MLYQAKLPLEFWAEACSTAVYLHNRSPTAALKDETPFQRLFGRRPDISNLRVFGCVCYVHVPDSQRRKLDAKAHKAIFIGYPPCVKGYKLYDLEKRKFVVSRDVQFFEENFDHFDEKDKSDDADQADLRFIFPDMNQENESAPVPLLPEAPQVQENVKPPVQENVELTPVQSIKSPSPQNVETVGERVNEEEPVRRTYEDAFMEEVRNLGPVRQRRMPSRFQDYDCLLVDSEIDEPSTVHEALNSDQCDRWKDAMKSEYSSLIKNDTWQLVPPPEGKNIFGSRWLLKVKHNGDGSIDRFKADLLHKDIPK